MQHAKWSKHATRWMVKACNTLNGQSMYHLNATRWMVKACNSWMDKAYNTLKRCRSSKKNSQRSTHQGFSYVKRSNKSKRTNRSTFLMSERWQPSWCQLLTLICSVQPIEAWGFTNACTQADIHGYIHMHTPNLTSTPTPTHINSHMHAYTYTPRKPVPCPPLNRRLHLLMPLPQLFCRLTTF